MNCNLAEIICRRHEDAIFRIALEEVRCSGSNTYTFGGLDYLSDKFATVLCDCGIVQGDVVAVALPSSAALVVAHFAALKLGAAVAPFNAELNKKLINRLIKQSQAKVLVIDETLFKASEKWPGDLQGVALFIASDYVSKNDFGAKGRGFWYEINFADADFKTVMTEITTPAYIFLEQVGNGKWASTISTHGIIVEGLRRNAQHIDFECNAETPVQITNDWSAEHVLFDMLYPAWFSGCSIMALAQMNEKDKGLP
jgi:acetyl-CoA synthetase